MNSELPLLNISIYIRLYCGVIKYWGTLVSLAMELNMVDVQGNESSRKKISLTGPVLHPFLA